MNQALPTSRRVIVGIGDMKPSSQCGDVLATHALGASIGVAVHDPVNVVGGLLHFMLPDSLANPRRAEQNPWLFGDVAIPLFLAALCDMGADRSRLIIKVAGGAQFVESGDFFAIGKRNHVAVHHIARKANVPIHAEHIGGTQSRTLMLQVATGRTWIACAGAEIDL